MCSVQSESDDHIFDKDIELTVVSVLSLYVFTRWLRLLLM